MTIVLIDIRKSSKPLDLRIPCKYRASVGRPGTTTYATLSIVLLCLCSLAGQPAFASPPPAEPVRLEMRLEVVGLIRQLDSDRFEVRRRAATQLDALMAKPELAELLATEFSRVLLSPEVSFEVRWRLEHWRQKLPHEKPATTVKVSEREIDRLVEQLEDETYAIRLGASQRLRWMLKRPELACLVYSRLWQRMEQPLWSADIQQWLDPVYQQARAAWLLSEPNHWRLPEVSRVRLEQMVNRLLVPLPADASKALRHTRFVAKRQLQDLLARDAYVESIETCLRKALAQPDLTAKSKNDLQELLDLTRPAMVAEYWELGHNLGEQHLLVGVPSMSEFAQRPSHFDRIDEKTAHCVSGNSLSPGDYPVGVAFPHPLKEDAFFQLVHLPTPRQRMRYTYWVQTEEKQRLTVLSRRTLNSYLAQKRALTESELVMLGQLDPEEVSRFAGTYFHTIEDTPLPLTRVYPERADSQIPTPDLRYRMVGRCSHHAMLCLTLAYQGTRSAIPPLLSAIKQNRFLPSVSSYAPYRLEWIAALSIASRDPWPEVDSWLFGLTERTEPLVDRPEFEGAELGATAASLLLVRHKQSPLQFGLKATSLTSLKACHVNGYSFTSEGARQEFRRWWHQQSDRTAKKKPHPPHVGHGFVQ